ncbi:hypothetical protein ABZ784_29075 [Streptomyces tendae]|uniref:hypothetical protein n=1 Tax=Streptomyces tendae TaxID=1932 RepID=UPI00340BA37C
MATLAFQPAEAGDDNPDYDDTACQCPPGDKNYLLEIDEGQAVLVHAACGKPPSHTWGDFQDLVTMDPIPVTVEWMGDSGSMWEEPDPWVQITATSVPEDARKQALELTRKHAAERNA